ncbi:MAG TPA: hypothetical protein VG224_02030 [Reyranella sp.]|jgi:hypothetical protein|nr:hypothetical protein [Reyranella sp.]
MDTTSFDRMLAALAGLAALIVAAMVVGIVSTGMSQDFFQSARPIEAHIARLTASPLGAAGLRINLGLDNLFIVVYGAFFVFLAVRLRTVLDPWAGTVALAAILLTAFLDAIENHHILMMLHSAERGLPLSTGESQLQMVVSAVKFHSSYLATFLLAFGFLRLGGLGRAIACALWLYVPLGVVISVLPVETAGPWALGRTCFFVAAFVLSAVLFWRSARA